MAGQVNPVPEGYRTVTPYLVVDDANGALEYYKKAFGATAVVKMDGPGGKISHAEFRIGDSMLMMSDEMPRGPRSPKSLGGSPVSIFLYVNDVDSVFKQAVDAGAKGNMPPQDMFWGDRFGKLTDPFGHEWALATHIEDVAPEEMKKRMEAFQAQMAQSAGQGS
ncbi:MAG: VOC family protein [Acidobacteriaceae bacterium]|nr:VOC family protein [Acidobacteriaceae bacterium]MBV9297114.1 VOC family protein [Acidobacteriaceae bacterium]